MERTYDIGIIGAMSIEIETIRGEMTDTHTETVGGIEFVSGTLRGKTVVTAKCGIGKVFAAMCTQAMILHYAPAVIVNTGVAGTMTDRLAIGDVALATRVVQHDMDTSAIGDPVGLISGINMIYLPTDASATDRLAACVEAEGVCCVRGTVASGDQFIHSEAQKDKIRAFDDVVACEMEGAAIGHVCYVNRVPCAILRAISDGGDEAAATDYPTFLRGAAATASAVLLRFVQSWQE